MDLNPRTPTPWRSLLRDYFYFSKWQRRTLLLLWGIMIGIAAAEFYRHQQPLPPLPVSWQALASAEKTVADRQQATRPRFATTSPTLYSPSTALFPFDPNTAGADTLRMLGFRENTLRTLLKYREKGGRFRKPEDLGRLYGLRPEEASRLIPYVRMAAPAVPPAAPTAATAPMGVPAHTRKATPQPLDINLADTTAWKALPGIGSRLAARIVNFRDKLGGFHTIDQVAETYALPDSTFQQIRPLLLPGTAPLRKIPLNTAPVDAFKAHPYFSSFVATRVVQYRQQHGPFKSVEDLRKIHLPDYAWLEKVMPYLSLE